MKPQACKLGASLTDHTKVAVPLKHFGVIGPDGKQVEMMITTCGRLLQIKDGKHDDLQLRLPAGETIESAYDKCRSGAIASTGSVVDFC